MFSEKIIDVARGKALGDFVLKNGTLINVLSGETYKTDVIVVDGYIAGLGDYENALCIRDIEGKFVIPGLIDGHIHLESTLLTPGNFAKIVLPQGTTTVIADPHEIVNVCGLTGLEYMIKSSKEIILDVFYMIPSCVPSSPFEKTAFKFGPEEILKAFELYPESPGLAEMMNYPGVIEQTPEVLEKIRIALDKNKLIDGHSPQLSGKKLSAYIAANISTEHECTTGQEALEKIRLGMKIAIREGSAAKNLLDLIPVINQYNSQNTFFCCDDRNIYDLLHKGGIIHALKKSVKSGLPLITAIQMSTINTARHYRLFDRGALAPGLIADIAVIDEIEDFRVDSVYKRGTLVAKKNELLVNIPSYPAKQVSETIQINYAPGSITKPLPASRHMKGKIIEVIPGKIITKSLTLPYTEIEKSPDICLIAILNRYEKNPDVKTGFVKGFGALKGALGSSIAHDSHNLVLVGDSTEDMEIAARELISIGGGQIVVADCKVLALLPLPVGGLMSTKSPVFICSQYEKLHQAAEEINTVLPDPFMTMSFLSLPVIPELKITDKGLVNVNEFMLTDLWSD